MIQKTSVYFLVMIRTMDLDCDWDSILRIEQETNHNKVQWDKKDFESCTYGPGFVMVADLHGSIVGFVVCEPHDGMLDVLNFAVMRKMWRKKIGTRLVEESIAIARAECLDSIRIRVRESNLGAQMFLDQQLFICLPENIVCGYYNLDTQENAYTFTYPILDKVMPRNRVRRFMQQWKGRI